MDKVFGALADRSRRRLLDRLNSRNGQSLRELCAGLDMTRQSVSKHLAVLEEANLVSTMRVGREKLHYLNAVPINEIAERWITEYDQVRVRALSDLKRALEGSPLNRPAFVYTIYIKTTSEQLWRALTDPAFTRRWWGMAPVSDWRVGSPMTWEHEGLIVADPARVVLESDPYRRLAYTWPTMTPELAHRFGVSDVALASMAREPRSTVSFDLEPGGRLVKLTVVHDNLEPGSATLELISGGWPRALSGLKTLLETGETLE
ncbi:MAG: ArsR/SmtB family transcription factor, partial [Ktedonobacterales bacterium]